MFYLGHLECSFEKSVEMFLRKSRIFFNQCPWLIKKGRKNQKNPSKFSKGHVEGDLDNPTLKNVNKKQKLFRSMSKIEMKKSFLRISVFLGNVRMESSFGSPAEIFLTITEKFSLNPCFFWKTSFCWEKTFFPRNVSMDTQLQSLTTPPILFRKRSNSSPTTSESDEIVLFPKTPRNVPVDRWNAVLTTPPKLFRKEA